MLAKALCFLAAIANGQDRRAFNTDQLNESLEISLGSTLGIKGVEINFWMRPRELTADVAEQDVLQFLNKFIMTLEYSHASPHQYVLRTYMGSRTGVVNRDYWVQESVVSKAVGLSQFEWVNVNVMVKFSFFCEVNVWRGVEQAAPRHTQYFEKIGSVSSLALKAYLAPSSKGVFLGEIRAFKQQNELVNYGFWTRFYKVAAFPEAFSTLLQEIFVASSGVLYLDKFDTSKQKVFSVSNTVAIGWNHCDPGKAPSSLTQCTGCSQSGCLFCPTADAYAQTCRFCDPLSTTCTPVTTCPDDFYLGNGVCKRCPVGCKRCTDSFTCTLCDSGLTLAEKTPGFKLCHCASNKFGTPNYDTDTLTCANCDAACLTCNNTASTCTSCASPTYLQNSSCVADCKALVPNSWHQLPQRICQPCVDDCTSCNSLNCDVCDPGFLYHNGNCLATCPTDAVEETPGSCTDCEEGCATCLTTHTNCQTCDNQHYLHLNSCVDACPGNMFANGDRECTLCASECTSCATSTYCYTCDPLYYFVKNTCKLACVAGYYPEDGVPGYKFCRDCPSTCSECTGAETCTQCKTGTYMHTQLVDPGPPVKNVVSCKVECEPYTFANPLTQACDACIADCRNCTSSTNCHQCIPGKHVYVDTAPNPDVYSCVTTCPVTFFANQENICQECGADCDTCDDQFTCTDCSAGFVFQEGQCLAACSPGFYDDSGVCKKCPKECKTCTSLSTCTDCIDGFKLDSGDDCRSLCGNGKRDHHEECDDKNERYGDGCSEDCKIEPGYYCWPKDPNKDKEDVCVCDSKLITAVWDDFWGSISIKFGTPIVYSEKNAQKKENDAQAFCEQILRPDTYSVLGNSYSCILRQNFFDRSIYELNIYVGRDSKLASKANVFQSVIKLKDNVLVSQVCGGAIPTTYTIRNLALSTPQVQFSLSSGTNQISECSSDLVISLGKSKGLTKRDLKITWNFVSLTPGHSSLKKDIENVIFDGFKNQLHVVFQRSMVERLKGYQLKLGATIENFLGNKGYNETTITFLSERKIEIFDIMDVYTLDPTIENKFSPRFLFPYCAKESVLDANANIAELIVKCYLYNKFNTIRIQELYDCVIPPSTMTLGTDYSVLINAYHVDYPTYSLYKFAYINTKTPDLEVASVFGSNRLFSAAKGFWVRALLNIDPASCTFSWYCKDLETGSSCFDREYRFINFADSPYMQVAADTLWPGQQYDFELIVYDSISKVTTTSFFSMYAASEKTQDKVLDVFIDSESNVKGYLDLQSQLNAWKGILLDKQEFRHHQLAFAWEVQTSGQAIDKQHLQVFNNSIGINSAVLSQNSIYTVLLNVTDGVKSGFCYQMYRSNPEISFEFRVFPEKGTALVTSFAFVLTEQQPQSSLNTYSFGYKDEQGNLVPLTQKTQLNTVTSTLPPLSRFYTSSATAGTVTCFVRVIKPNGTFKTSFYDVTVQKPTSSVADFANVLKFAFVDDLIESVQIAGGVQVLQSALSDYEKTLAVTRLLDGLQTEDEDLHDLFIQESAASILYICSTLLKDAVKSEPGLLVRIKRVFSIMVKANTKTQSVKFKEKTTNLLLQTADTIFATDFGTNVSQADLQEGLIGIYEYCLDILKGTIHNQVLGQNGGYSFQGNQISVRTVVCKYLLHFSRQFDQQLRAFNKFAPCILGKAGQQQNRHDIPERYFLRKYLHGQNLLANCISPVQARQVFYFSIKRSIVELHAD